MVEYFAIGKPCQSDEDCPESCYTGRVKLKYADFKNFLKSEILMMFHNIFKK